MREQHQTTHKVEFSMMEFLGVTIKGAILAFVAIVLLLVIGFLFVSKKESPLMPEGTFKLITFVLLAVVVGGLSSGGAYARHMWKAGAKAGTLYGVVVGMLIGGSYFPLQVFAINPVLCRFLHIPYNNKISLIQAIIVGIIAALFFMWLGYIRQKDEEKPTQGTTSAAEGNRKE